jgi:hypothetical protein
MATLLSHAEGLLVVREQRASLPNLAKQGRLAPENVMVVAQMQGESHEAFAVRVRGRANRKGNLLRAAVVSLEANASFHMVESRQSLIPALARALTAGPESELVIMAPANIGAKDRIELFELVESTLRAAPSVNVCLAFSDPTEKGGRRHPIAKGFYQPAEA